MITKQEALAKLNAKDDASLKLLTNRVETELTAYSGRPINVYVDSFSEKSINEVIRIYSTPAAGWSVHLRRGTGDQRDSGSWLEFS